LSYYYQTECYITYPHVAEYPNSNSTTHTIYLFNSMTGCAVTHIQLNWTSQQHRTIFCAQ